MKKFKQWLIPGPRVLLSAPQQLPKTVGGLRETQGECHRKTYQVAFTIAKQIVADVISELEVLRQHHSVRLESGSDRPETVICAGLDRPSDHTLQFSLQCETYRCKLEPLQTARFRFQRVRGYPFAQ